jgi:hypothetical protein
VTPSRSELAPTPNAYAAPRAPIAKSYPDDVVSDSGLIGVRHEATLPSVCATCGAPGVPRAGRRADPDLNGPRAFVALLVPVALVVISFVLYRGLRLLVYPLIFIASYLPWSWIVSSRSPLTVPQCAACGRRWRQGTWLQSAGVLIQFVGNSLALWLRIEPVLALPIFLGCFALGWLASMTFGRPRIVVRVARVDTERVWLRGVHADAAQAWGHNPGRSAPLPLHAE